MYDSIVGIIGVPRSGTSWVGQIFDSAPNVLYRMQPFYSWAFRDKIHVRSSEEEINRYFEDLYNSSDSYLDQTERREQGVYPIFKDKDKYPEVMVFKEVMFHYMVPVLIKHIKKIHFIAIVRHPIDVLTSYYNAPREFDPSLDIQKEWYFAQSRNELLPERYFGYHKWKEYIKIITVLQEQYPDKFTVVKYEDLLGSPETYVDELFHNLHIIFGEQTERFIYESQHKTVDDPYSVFRNKNEKAARRNLPESIINKIHKDLKDFDEAFKLGYE